MDIPMVICVAERESGMLLFFIFRPRIGIRLGLFLGSGFYLGPGYKKSKNLRA